MENTQVSQPMEISYLYPDQLIPNEANAKARPTETEEQRKVRVERMAVRIHANGQNYPVLAVASPEGEGIYEYVDGGGRVDAIRLINEGFCTNGTPPEEPMLVAVIVHDTAEDLFKLAVTSNIHRDDVPVADVIGIIREARERNGFKGRGADAEIARYLGMNPSRISEYKRISSAPPEILTRIQSGEIRSLDAALKLMAVPEESRVEVMERAASIAKEEKTAGKQSSKLEDSKSATAAAAEPPPITAANVAAAAAESGHIISKRNIKAISETFAQITEAAYGPEAVAFADFVVGEFIPGSGTDKKFFKLFDEMIGTDSAQKKERAREYKAQQKLLEEQEAERIGEEAEAEAARVQAVKDKVKEAKEAAKKAAADLKKTERELAKAQGKPTTRKPKTAEATE